MDLTTMKRKVILNKKLLIFGFLFGLSSQVNHPFGLTLLHDKLYWTDWKTNAVYRADVNTGANIVLMAGNLGKPMDIHAYSAPPKQYVRYHYTFSFPKTGSNFTCMPNRSCPVIPSPPQCPPGFTNVRENITCGLNCRDIVGYTWRCPCVDWMSCAVKERYLFGCKFGSYASFRVRECKQVVKKGRCPQSGISGSQQACSKDYSCPGNEKCCKTKCVSPVSTEIHACQKNNGGCDQLCFPVPGAHECGCENGYLYDSSQKKCIADTRPTTPPPTTKPPGSCKPHPPPKNGSVTCHGDPVPSFGQCTFTCDEGLTILGFDWDICFLGEWLDPTPTCVLDPKPKFSHCYNDTVIPNDPGKSYAIWNWIVPTATDYNGTKLDVTIDPEAYKPPVKLNIGGPNPIQLSAKDKFFESISCKFNITVEDREPPSFGSTCPPDIAKFVDKNQTFHVPEAKHPTATDNSGKPPSIYKINHPHDLMFPVGETTVTFHATDDANLKAECVHVVNITNVCAHLSCTHGAKCMISGTKGICACNTFCPQGGTPVCGSDGNTYSSECTMKVEQCTKKRNITVVRQGKCTAAESCDTVTCDFGAVCQVINEKVQCVCQSVCPEIYDPVCGSDLNTYSNECAMKAASCSQKKSITLVKKGKCGDCSTVKCGFGAQCEVKDGVAKCECDITCADSPTPVCASNGVTYATKCDMLKAQCRDQTTIQKIGDGPCGCDENLEMSDDYKQSSSVECKRADNTVSCEVKCKQGHNAVFPDFLKLLCYKKKWIRKNNNVKYVPISSGKSPPRCYEATPKPSGDCPKLTMLMETDKCVPCPPGSYYDNASKVCKECEITYYQDKAQQISCKACSGAKTSTTTGAESCFFDHGSNTVAMVFEDNQASGVTKEKLRTDLAKALTDVCKTTTCSFDENDAVRKRRDAGDYDFKAEHVIIVSEIKEIENGQKEATLFVLDPTSTSLLPDKAFSSDNLKALLLKIKSGEIPGIVLKRVNTVSPPVASSGGDSSSKAPVIAGVIVAILVLVGVVFAIWMLTKRRRNKSDTIPPVQYNTGPEEMQIGQPSTVSSHIYDNPDTVSSGLQHGFVNQVYNDVHSPPPYYEASPIGKPTGQYVVPTHVYEKPDGEAGPLPEKEQLPDGSVVEIIPPKDGAVVDMRTQKADPPIKFFHKRNTIPNTYEVPDREIPSHRSRTPEADLKLEPPPKFDDAKLRVMKDKAASAMLPNVPRKKRIDPMDNNANQATGSQRADHQNVADVTKNQSES